MTHRLAQRLRDRLHGSAEDEEAGFALVLVMLLILIMTTVSLTALGYTLNQVGPTEIARKNVQTVNAANAGIQAALSRLRSATVAGAGNITQLPCVGTGATFQGPVEGSTDGDRFSTRVRYFPQNLDPTGHDQAWLTANAISCPLAQVPFYALLESSGTSTAAPLGRAQRSVRATYNFATTNTNVSGGQMRDGSNANCMDVGSSPAVGTVVTWQTCLAVGAAQQVWAYRGDMDLYWAGGGTTYNLCLDYRTYDINGTSPTAKPITLQTCLNAAGSPGMTYPYVPALEQTQEFASYPQWKGVEANGERSGNDCIGTLNNNSSPGQQVLMSPNNCTNLNPDSGVGSGAASAGVSGVPGPTQQIVNYQAFGTCLDVYGSDPTNGYIIGYSCHAAADPTKVEGNQRFAYTPTAGVGTITSMRTDDPNHSYTTVCLTSPATVGNPVGVYPCTGGSAQQWTITGLTADYDESYTIHDLAGNCLALTTGNGHTSPYKYAVMADCDGSNGQKWNAQPGTRQLPVSGVVETTGQS